MVDMDKVALTEFLEGKNIKLDDFEMMDRKSDEYKNAIEGYTEFFKDWKANKDAEKAKNKSLGISELDAEGEEKSPKEEEKGLSVSELKEESNEKEPWSKWAEAKGYAFEAKNQENPESDFEIKDKEGKQIVKMQKDGDKMSVASQKYEVYQKIVGDAQIDKYNFINVGENMSPEQSALLAAACLEKGMKFENGPKSIDLNMECLKDLPDDVKAKIAEYNEKGQQEKTKEPEVKIIAEKEQSDVAKKKEDILKKKEENKNRLETGTPKKDLSPYRNEGLEATKSLSAEHKSQMGNGQGPLMSNQNSEKQKVNPLQQKILDSFKNYK